VGVIRESKSPLTVPALDATMNVWLHDRPAGRLPGVIMTRLFISYRREDSEGQTGRIYDRLVARFGKEAVFIDVDKIPFGVDFVDHLGTAVSQCDILLAMIGGQWLEVRHKEGPLQGQRRLDDPADFVRIEIHAALERNIPVIPVLLGRTPMPGQECLPTELQKLARRNAAEVRTGRDFHGDVDRLIEGIEFLLRTRPGPATPPAALGQEPGAGPHGSLPKLGDLVTTRLGMKFAWIPPGTFLMGCPREEVAIQAEPFFALHRPHRVTLTRGFYLSIHPVTRGQFAVFVEKTGHVTQAEREGGAALRQKGSFPLLRLAYRLVKGTLGVTPPTPGITWRSPGFQQADDHPVTCVSWHDAVAFAAWLAETESKAVRLPTEAEWEYACRAGSTGPFPWSEELARTIVNHDGPAARKQTTPVGKALANACGLHDLHGNVLEWCSDWLESYTPQDAVDPQGPGIGERRVLRGGSWFCALAACGSAARSSETPDFRANDIGFRLCFSH
jgi:formylglycine-generating enzyme required for sulfatase activity